MGVPMLLDAHGRPLRELPTRREMAVAAARAGFRMMASGYTGARSDRDALRMWNPGLGSADLDSLPDRPTLVARSRDLARNSPLAVGALATTVTSTVGTGLAPRPQLDREVLGLSEEEASAWERRAEQIFWAVADDLDITRQQTFSELQALVFRSTLESGDVFAVRRFKERFGDVLGLKIQIIEGDRVTNPQHQFDTERLVAGVEMDEDGAPIRYHVLNRHPGSLWPAVPEAWTAVPAFSRRTGARVTLHLFDRRSPGQTRGIPHLAPVIEKLKQLDRYADAELMAAVVSSMFTVFIKTESEMGLARIETDDPGDAAKDELTAGGYRLGHGLMVELNPGESIETANPGRPNDKFDPFVLAMLRQVGVALELPFELLVKHFTASYSAARAALLEAWRFFRVRRAWLAANFCRPVYGWVIEEAVARGLLDAPGFFEDPLIRRAWLGCEWIGDAPGQINELDETRAAVERVNAGLSSLEHESAQITGRDWQRTHEQRTREHAARVAAGLEADAAAPQGATSEGEGRRDRDREDSQGRVA